ncbi:MAG: peptidase T [Clostridia bacterium]|nr:peptidase T [Clostridia bacterium]
MSVKEKFLDYIRFDTQSDETTGTIPSTEKQKTLGAYLVENMKQIGITDAHMDEWGYVYGTIPANCEKKNTIGFIAHMDTSPDFSGKDVKARIIENYDGKDIVLNEELGIVTTVKDFPNLLKHVGKTLIVTDGTTLLGADDKAGIAEIMQAADEILHSDIPHGTVRIAFTPDEEIGGGTAKFDVPGFGCDFAYTVDGGDLGELEYENFNGASARVTVTGRSVHPGSAKDKLINANKIAMEFDSLLPQREVPENTEGYEGFAHLLSFKGEIEHAELIYIIRDHDKAKLDARKDKFVLAADFLNKKYGRDLVKAEVKDSYSNMKEMILPHMEIIDVAKAAMKKNGVEPLIVPIRGGTDGAALSFMGLPCPNMCTGGDNMHGKHEFAVLESMESIVDIIKTIIEMVE